MGIQSIKQFKLSLKDLKGIRVPLSPSSNALKGVQAERANFAPVLILGLLTSFGLVSFFSHSAYAASYINVSSGSGGTISLGSIKPSSSGVSASGSDTLSISTNCSTGYSVYVSGQKDKDTNLTNTNSSVTSNNTISTSSTAVGSTAAALSSNTWGISNTSGNTYVGLPSYADAINTPLITASSASTSSANTAIVYYGVKVDTSLAPGTYQGDILYTAMVSGACDIYTVKFNANGGTGTMTDQTIDVGKSTTLSTNTFTRDGYNFLGWSTKSTGKTGTASDGIGTESDVDYTNEQSVTDITDFNSSITLYAIWEADAPAVVYMQDFTYSNCDKMSVGEQITLIDSRDDHEYAIKKLPDNKCWMVQNLTLGDSNSTAAQRTLTSNSTNIDNNTIYYLPRLGYQGDITSSSTLTSTSAPANFNYSNDNYAKTQYRAKDSSITNDSDTMYYNFYTATLGFSYYNDDSKSSGSSTRDICPKGWRLPWTSDSSETRQGAAEFYALALAYNSNSSVWINYISPTSTGANSPSTSDSVVHTSIQAGVRANGNNYAGFSSSGYWNGTNTSSTGVGSNGYYWSSSIYYTNNSYSSYVSTSNVSSQQSSAKYFGYAIRCIAKQASHTINYSSNGADAGTPSRITDGIALDGITIAMPTAGTMTKAGHKLKGWAFIENAEAIVYYPGQSASTSGIFSSASAAGQNTTSDSTIILYPVWEHIPIDEGNLGTMQNFICSSLTPGNIATLTDARDSQSYGIYRWPNTGTININYPTGMAGYCIMTKDLSLGYITGGSITKGRDLSLTSSTSNYDSNASNSSYESFTLSGTQTVTARTNTSNWSTVNNYTNKQYINGTGDTYDSHTYYSWGAALVVCPKGWRLPTKTEYDNIIIFMGGNNSSGASKIEEALYNFIRGGEFNSDNGFQYTSRIGWYHSSTQHGFTDNYSLVIGSSSLNTSNHDYKNFGASVRCIATP